MTPSTLTLREETPADIAAIHTLTIAAFLNTPHTDHNEQHIVDALRQAGALHLSLVAQEGGQTVGHVAISPVTVSDGAQGWYGLGPVSVLPACQGRGIGRQLIEEALQRLRAGGAAGCVVLGEPAYYARFGFAPQPGLILPGLPSAYFQALAWSAPLPQGTVSYHRAFGGRE